MLSSRFLLIPFALQALLMAVDEFYFHWQRKLPRWERIGHPLDTLTVLLCLGFLLFVRPSPLSTAIYALLCIFSCLFVTKDEWVHKQECPAGEQWLHALLFILHPLLFISAGLLWMALHSGLPNLFDLIRYEGFERRFFISNLGLIFAFGLYQAIYWNLLWKKLPVTSSTMTSTTTWASGGTRRKMTR